MSLLDTINSATQQIANYGISFKDALGFDSLQAKKDDFTNSLGGGFGQSKIDNRMMAQYAPDAQLPAVVDATSGLRSAMSQAGIINPSFSQLTPGNPLAPVRIPTIPATTPPAKMPDPYGAKLNEIDQIERDAGLPPDQRTSTGALDDNLMQELEIPQSPGLLEQM